MTTTLSQSQAELPRLVELASRGEDVVITVDGKPKARLTKANQAVGKEINDAEIDAWIAQLQQRRAQFASTKPGPSVEQLLAEDRDRA